MKINKSLQQGRNILKYIRIKLKLFKFNLLLFAIVFVPSFLILMLVMYPGVIWHDDLLALITFAGKGYTEHVSLLWQMIAYPLLYLSKNIVFYALFQQLVISIAIVFSINKLMYLGILKNKRTAIMISVFYALCPTFLWFNQMLSVDVLFAVLLLPLTTMLIETVITKGVNLKRPSNVFIFVLLLFFVYEFRKNSLLIIPSTAIGLLIICKNYRKRIALIFGSVLACIFIFSLVTHQIYGYIYTDPNGEMYSVPIEQVGSVYAQKLYIPTHIKQEFDAVHPAKFWETNYDSQISDPLKNHVTVNSEFLKSWVKLGLKHPLTYTEAYFKLEYPFYSFGPNDVIGNYAIALTVSKQPALRQAYATMCKASKCLPSFKNQILAPGSKTQLNFADLPSQIVANGIPIISDMFNYLFFNTGLPFYVMLAVAVIAIRKRSFGLIVISIPLWCILLSFLLTAPVGQFRYSLQIYYILPVIIVLLCREHSLYRQKQNN